MAEKGIDPNFHDDRTGGKKLDYTWKSFVIVYMYPYLYLYLLFASYIYQQYKITLLSKWLFVKGSTSKAVILLKKGKKERKLQYPLSMH